jgi:hypothetical protein
MMRLLSASLLIGSFPWALSSSSTILQQRNSIPRTKKAQTPVKTAVKRANRALRALRTYLGQVTRDIVRKIKGQAELESIFALPLSLSRRVREQRKNQRGKKVYSLHVPQSNASAKARRIVLTSSASRFPSLQRSIIPRGASSSPTPRRFRSILMTATRWRPSFWRSRRRSASALLASSPTAAISARCEASSRRPQRAARSSPQGLYLRPEAARHRTHQTRVASPLRRRTGYRPRQRRASDGPKLPRWPNWRRDQRRPRRRRI